MEALGGVRVLELGSTVAGPFCGRLLADFGAEVVKVEPPSGDAVRAMGKHVDGKSLYAASIFRNKSLVAIDLSKPEGRDAIKRIVGSFDVLIENFRPGTLEKWGLGYAELSAINPGLVMARISGFGQDGPYRERPGYGFLGDAVSGLLGITGFPDRPPVRAAVPVTDMLTAIYTAFGIMMALRVRDRTGRGQCIDATLYESSFSLMESHVPAYDKLKHVPPRSGSRLPGSTPNNLYPTRDGRTIAIAAASDSVFVRLVTAMGAPQLAEDPRFREGVTRAKNEDAIDDLIAAWTRRFRSRASSRSTTSSPIRIIARERCLHRSPTRISERFRWSRPSQSCRRPPGRSNGRAAASGRTPSESFVSSVDSAPPRSGRWNRPVRSGGPSGP
jgi:crotonobetainyl-CoA:carnitine CoA-transferase CaiB-like acyl-CoA transferase